MFSPQIHRYIFLFGVLSLAFGMMMGTVPTSVPQIILMGNWLLEGRLKEKWGMLKFNKLFWILSSVFLSHVLGLLWTQDLQAGWNDVRTKIPMMFLPMLFLSSAPLSMKETRGLLYCFLTGCVANTGWCLAYTHILHKNEGLRNASRFMSHIRLGLYLTIAITVCASLFMTFKKASRWFFVLLATYFIFCMYALGLASGMINFALVVILALGIFAFRQKPALKLAIFGVLIVFVSGIALYINKVATAQLSLQPGPQNTKMEKTPWGSSYIHFEEEGQKENGNYVQINIELQELRKGWNKRMPQDSFSYIPEKNLQRYEVLLRYLASKGLNKDSAGIATLDQNDLENVNKNICNYLYPQWSFLHRRVYEAVNEFDELTHSRRVNGHSVSMRPYFWHAALHLISDKPVFGIGTGDVQSGMNSAYKEIQSPLNEEWYKRPHNQFLTITVALGVFGLVIFLLCLFYPAFTLRRKLPILYWVFFFVAIVSFFVEDTLETQAGQTFFAFFNSFFLSQAAQEGLNAKSQNQLSSCKT